MAAAVIERTLHDKPRDATRWSIRSMARETTFSHTTIRRIWNAFGLQPHRTGTFKLSSVPLFVDKVRDIVGLYPSPPNRALVLSVDEKSQIQALDRMSTSHRPQHHGSIRSSAGSPNSPANNCNAAPTRPSKTWRPIS
jgi:hypothetical protein